MEGSLHPKAKHKKDLENCELKHAWWTTKETYCYSTSATLDGDVLGQDETNPKPGWKAHSPVAYTSQSLLQIFLPSH